MRTCWEKSPESRPHFFQLVISFSSFFENTAEPLESVVSDTEESGCGQDTEVSPDTTSS